jgi:hypothetical protein
MAIMAKEACISALMGFVICYNMDAAPPDAAEHCP